MWTLLTVGAFNPGRHVMLPAFQGFQGVVALVRVQGFKLFKALMSANIITCVDNVVLGRLGR